MLAEEIERVLSEQLTEENVVGLKSGMVFTTVLEPEIMEAYFGDDFMAKCDEVVKILADLTEKWKFKLEIQYYFLPYRYVYMLLISHDPGDDDDETPLPRKEAATMPTPIPTTQPVQSSMTMSAKAGGH